MRDGYRLYVTFWKSLTCCQKCKKIFKMEIPGIAQDFKRDRRKLLLNTPLLAVNCWLLLFRKQKWWFKKDFNTIKVQLIIYRKNWFLLMLFLFAAKMMVYERFQHDKGSAYDLWKKFVLVVFVVHVRTKSNVLLSIPHSSVL